MKNTMGQELIKAAWQGDLDRVKQYLAEGVDISSVDESGRSALGAAVHRGHYGMVQLLLEKGADVNAVDKHGSTALHWAVWNRDEAMVQLLLDKRADANAKNHEWATPLEIASQQGHLAIKALLQRAATQQEGRKR